MGQVGTGLDVNAVHLLQALPGDLLEWGCELSLSEAGLRRRTRDETISVAIGIRPDGKLATLEGTPERRQQEWQLWEG